MKPITKDEHTQDSSDASSELVVTIYDKAKENAAACAEPCPPQQDRRSAKRKRRPAIPWDVMYQHLLTYKERFGHVKVTQKYVTEDGVKLGVWVMNQRTFLLHRQRGKYTSLSDTRIDLLDKVGFTWGCFSRDDKGKRVEFRGSSIPPEAQNDSEGSEDVPPKRTKRIEEVDERPGKESPTGIQLAANSANRNELNERVRALSAKLPSKDSPSNEKSGVASTQESSGASKIMTDTVHALTAATVLPFPNLNQAQLGYELTRTDAMLARIDELRRQQIHQQFAAATFAQVPAPHAAFATVAIPIAAPPVERRLEDLTVAELHALYRQADARLAPVGRPLPTNGAHVVTLGGPGLGTPVAASPRLFLAGASVPLAKQLHMNHPMEKAAMAKKKAALARQDQSKKGIEGLDLLAGVVNSFSAS